MTESTISIYLGPELRRKPFYLPNRIFWNFSHKPHFHNAISHSVWNFKIWSVPIVWIFFLSKNRQFFQQNQLSASTLGSEPHRQFYLSLPNRILWNFSHKPHFHNAITQSVRRVKIRSVPMVWIFFLSTNRNFFQQNQLGASTLGMEPHRHSIYLFQIESYGTFLTSHISTMLYHIVSEASKFGQFRWSGFFSYKQTGTFFNGINYGHPPLDRNCIDIPSISSKSNLLELF